MYIDVCMSSTFFCTVRVPFLDTWMNTGNVWVKFQQRAVVNMVSRSQLLRSWFLNDDVIILLLLKNLIEIIGKLIFFLFSFLFNKIVLKIVNGRFVVSPPENKEKKSPDPWDAYKLPNIHTARMKFYNDMVKKKYTSLHLLSYSLHDSRTTWLNSVTFDGRYRIPTFHFVSIFFYMQWILHFIRGHPGDKETCPLDKGVPWMDVINRSNHYKCFVEEEKEKCAMKEVPP